MQIIREVLEQNGVGTVVQNPRTSYTSAAGKAIICGEHAVVYGATAVALPLTAYKMHAALKVVNDERSSIQMILGERPVSENIVAVVHDAFEMFGIEPFPLVIEGRSQLPIGAGLGSSATLCVVVVRALSAAIGIEFEPHQVALAANHLEKRFHGRPSGLDTSVVAYEQIISFRVNESPKPLSTKSTWRFALIDSKVRAPTFTMIRKAEPFFAGSEGDQRIAEFDHWSQQVIHGLAEGNKEEVAEAMQAADKLLRRAGVVPTSLGDLIDISYQCGALAAKITGAGGGGAILALLPDEVERAQSVIHKLHTELPGHPLFEVEV